MLYSEPSAASPPEKRSHSTEFILLMHFYKTTLECEYSFPPGLRLLIESFFEIDENADLIDAE